MEIAPKESALAPGDKWQNIVLLVLITASLAVIGYEYFKRSHRVIPIQTRIAAPSASVPVEAERKTISVGTPAKMSFVKRAILVVVVGIVLGLLLGILLRMAVEKFKESLRKAVSEGWHGLTQWLSSYWEKFTTWSEQRHFWKKARKTHEALMRHEANKTLAAQVPATTLAPTPAPPQQPKEKEGDKEFWWLKNIMWIILLAAGISLAVGMMLAPSEGVLIKRHVVGGFAALAILFLLLLLKHIELPNLYFRKKQTAETTASEQVATVTVTRQERSWLKPVLVTVGGLALVAIIAFVATRWMASQDKTEAASMVQGGPVEWREIVVTDEWSEKQVLKDGYKLRTIRLDLDVPFEARNPYTKEPVQFPVGLEKTGERISMPKASWVQMRVTEAGKTMRMRIEYFK